MPRNRHRRSRSRSRHRDRKRSRRSSSRDRRRSYARRDIGGSTSSTSKLMDSASSRRSRSRERDTSNTPLLPAIVTSNKANTCDNLLGSVPLSSGSHQPSHKCPADSKTNDRTIDACKQDFNVSQTSLEMEMKRRRERVERWRNERKEQGLDEMKKALSKGEKPVLPANQSKKIWSLENDSDEDEESQSHKTDDVQMVDIAESEDEQIDPLDAYMQVVHAQVRKIKGSKQLNLSSQDQSQKQSDQPASVPSSSLASVTATAAGTTPADAAHRTSKCTVIKAVVIKKDQQSVCDTNSVTNPSPGVAVSRQSRASREEVIEQNQDVAEYVSGDEAEQQVELEDLLEISERIGQRGKKGVLKIDHNKVVYEPFRKNFWIEVPELRDMTQQQVDAFRAENDNIKVAGKEVAKPLRLWSQAGFSRKVMDVLKRCNYQRPTPIQAQAIPIILSGRDLIGIAKTGSGKTLAFVLPMIRHVLDQKPLAEHDGPIAVIMSPTRELCIQTGKECKKFIRHLDIRAVCVYGGTGISEQIAELKRGAEIIICTPGRMIDMLAANSGRVTNLTRVTYIVLDEADRMFDMGFEPQVMRVIDNVRPDKQCLLFSATFPRQMEALARRILSKPVEVQVGGRSVVCKDVEQHIVVLEDGQKFFKLLELLGKYHSSGSVIVFVDKQESADDLLKDLIYASYPCLALHGAVDQYDRDSIMADFKSGRVKLLVATSVAARGLDVKQLILVVNYDCPNHYEDYVHRCGRTGRAGNHGYAYTFITPSEPRAAGDIIKALHLSESPVPEELTALWETYKCEQKNAGKSVKLGSGGFGGRGFKFDDTEQQIQQDMKRFQKVAHGLEDSDDDDPTVELDDRIQSLLAPKRTVTELKQGQSGPTSVSASSSSSHVNSANNTGAVIPVTESPALLPTPILPPYPYLGANMGMPNASMIPAMFAAVGSIGASATPAAANNAAQNPNISNVINKLEIARQAAVRIQQNQQQQLDSRNSANMMSGHQLTSKMVAEQLAAKINSRLNYNPDKSGLSGNTNKDHPEFGHYGDTASAGSGGLDDKCADDKETVTPVVRKYEEELDINDFPQHTRWRICTKETLTQVADYSEASITVKGAHYTPAMKVPEGERRLYLAIESVSELAVSKAKTEITRIIKEDLLRAQTMPYSAMSRGRYKVI